MVDKLGRLADVPNSQIAVFARFKRARPAEAAKGSRRLPRHAGQAFRDTQAKQSGRHVHGEKRHGQWRGSRITVRGNGNRHSGIAQ